MKKALILLSISILLFSCSNDSTEPKPNPDGVVNRTVLIYMVADNNLYSNALDDINELESVWKDSYDGKVLVYLNPKSSTIPSRLYQIQRGQNNEIDSKIIKEYSVQENAVDPAILHKVIADVRELSPSNSYGLIFWSHGTGWIPAFAPPMNAPAQRSAADAAYGPQYTFGYNDTYRKEMEIPNLAQALPDDLVFDFIAFDACYMAGIEVAYELRSKTKYMIAAASETLAEGFPYNLILGSMMTQTADVQGIVTKTFDHICTYTGASRSSTLSVTDCTKLEMLAAALKEVVSDPGEPTEFLLDDIQTFAVNSFNNKPLYYDIVDFVEKTWPNSPKLANFKSALQAAVVIEKATPILYSSWPVRVHSGLTAYIPLERYPNMLIMFREQFAWSVDSGLSELAF